MTKTEQMVKSLVESAVTELGYELYDVMYLKESNEWFLRLFIDKPDGRVDLDDCEKVSNKVSDILDEKDPISESYNLEVSSCGVERHIREKSHFVWAKGKNIEVKTYAAIDKKKEFTGVLEDCLDDEIEIQVDGQLLEIKLDNIAGCKLSYSWEELKNE